MADGARERPGEKVGVIVIHGVGETQPGWINDYLVTELQKRAPDLLFDPHSEVHRLPDETRKAGARFPVYVRRARFRDTVEASFIELFWNDLSKIGSGPVTGTYAALKLFYEAPQVLGEGFLLQCRHGIYRFLRFLVLLANWILRWPISGINTAAFGVALAWIGLRQLKMSDQYLGTNVVPIVMTLLLLIAALSIAFARWRVHRDIALTDIGLSTALSALGLAVLVAVAAFVVPDIATGSIAPYLMVAGQLIFGFFLFWNLVVVAGIFLIGGLALWRLLMADRHPIALARPAAALGLTTLQGIAWKIAISALWILVIAAAEPGSLDPTKCTSSYTKACDFLSNLNNNLAAITLVNFGLAALVALSFMSIGLLRRSIRRMRPAAVMAQKVELPRLIVSPVVITVLFTGTALAVLGYYVGEYDDYLRAGGAVPEYVRPMLGYYRDLIGYIKKSSLLQAFIGGTGVLSIYFWIVGALRQASLGVLHIARDIVDHQYTPRFAMSRILLPNKVQQRGRHPRRERIEKRLDALMENVVNGHGFDRLVFVAHSQGTVILYDYLRTRHDEASIRGVSRIDVITLASPLTHLYQHYFLDYERKTGPAADLNTKLATWTNLWRADDPIGHRVDIVEGNFVVNEPIKPGGHINYWKEDPVCGRILGLVHPALAVAGAVDGPSAKR